MQGVALLAVVGGGATAKRRVLAQAGMAVVVGNGLAQRKCIDAAGIGQCFDGRAGFQVAGANEWRNGQRERAGDAKPIAALEAVAADQPGSHFFTRGGGNHG
ncbi:hypothetical protein D3C80_1325060 [compost metagenome]